MGARRTLSPESVDVLLLAAGIAPAFRDRRGARVTREQLVRLYEVVALATGDEMLGLWSRPIRGGTLKYLGLSLLDAQSVLTAMYRFTRFWNLLLDDYTLSLSHDDDVVTLSLAPLMEGSTPIVFGHELMIKLSHGIASWLVGRELPVVAVGFGFPCPDHFLEYGELIPGPVTFDQPCTSISFVESVLRQRFRRSKQDLLDFVRHAPDDWIFVTFDHGTTSARVREYLTDKLCGDLTLEAASTALFLSSRTLSRKLAAERTTFQKIKDDMRRDLAIQQLVKTHNSIDAIALSVGFDNTPAFHRAFRTWTGGTPGAYRRQSGAIAQGATP